ncbi:MAG: hypothetical protein K2L67_06890 [Clostridia bacterium]|nr:hypothetical protein [Clostridia bacterium]
MRLTPHNAAWFAKQEARLEEPLKNTKRYYTRREVIKMFSLLYCPPVGLFLAPVGLYNLIKTYKRLNDVETDIAMLMNKGRAVTFDGTPGSGKTFTGKELAYILARKSWEQLKSDYYTQRTMVAQWVLAGDTVKLEAFKALEESYQFYKKNEKDYIPCLVSSVPLREYGTGRMSYKLTDEMFLQIDRLPERTVIFNDESGLDQGADTSTTADKDRLAHWRFFRQFYNGMFVNTNQDGKQNGIYMRRSTDFVNHLFGQEWLKEPRALQRKFERKQEKFYKKLNSGQLSDKQADYFGQELYYLEKYIATIGFRRITCRTTTKEGAFVSDEKIILPAIGGVQYNDRAFRNLYKCKDKEIDLKGWESLDVQPPKDGQPEATAKTPTSGKQKSKRKAA